MDTADGADDDAADTTPGFEAIESLRAVDTNGNLCLYVTNHSDGSPFRYRVSSDALRRASRYFDNLLTPGRFQEGIELSRRLECLALEQASAHTTQRLACSGSQLQPSALPVLKVQDVETPTVSSGNDVLFYFLQCAHGSADFQWLAKQRLGFVFSLAIVADRFFARDCVRPAMRHLHESREHSMKQKPSLTRSHVSMDQETTWRQRLLLAIWFDFPDWAQQYSQLLIVYGSCERTETETNPGGGSTSFALWRDLPEGIEGS